MLSKMLIKIKRVFRAIGRTFTFVMGVKGEIRKEAEADGICNYRGQE